MSSARDTVVQRQVADFFGHIPSFQNLSTKDREAVLHHTADVVKALATDETGRPDPYATGLADDPPVGQIIGDAANLAKGPGGELGDVIGVGTTQAGRMLQEVSFPQFVASLIDGTFNAIVKSSMDQMKAYAELVKSVSTSLSDFRDQNTSDDEAASSIFNKFPSQFQVNIDQGRRRLAPRDALGIEELPDFASEFDLEQPVTTLDQDTIEEVLIPAARDQLAKQRHQLLATTLAMGINRIIVTDGQINAKVVFSFSAQEQNQMTAQATDYANVGNIETSQSDFTEQGVRSSRGGWLGTTESTGKDYVSSLVEQSAVVPDIRVTTQVDKSTVGAIQAAGQFMGAVNINFRSETFPLERLVDTDQLTRINAAQGFGATGAPPAAETNSSQAGGGISANET